MNQRDILQRIQTLRRNIKTLESENDKRNGKLEYLKNKLNELGIPLDEADKHLERMEKEISGIESEINNELEKAERICRMLEQ